VPERWPDGPIDGLDPAVRVGGPTRILVDDYPDMKRPAGIVVITGDAEEDREDAPVSQDNMVLLQRGTTNPGIASAAHGGR
jgi:hypothetical protein